MFKIVKSLFGTTPAAPAQVSQSAAKPNSLTGKDFSIESYFRAEVDNSEYLRDGAKQKVLDHLLGKIDIIKTGSKLSPDEKKALGLNTRLTITKEMVEVLNEKAIRLAYPSSVLTEMWSRATTKKSRHDQLEKLRASAVKKYKLITCGNGEDCIWCQAHQEQEFQAQFDLESAIAANCTCEPYCKCLVQPIIEF